MDLMKKVVERWFTGREDLRGVETDTTKSWKKISLDSSMSADLHVVAYVGPFWGGTGR